MGDEEACACMNRSLFLKILEGGREVWERRINATVVHSTGMPAGVEETRAAWGRGPGARKRGSERQM